MELPYGKTKLTVDLPREWQPYIFRPASATPANDPIQEIQQSLTHPLGNRKLEDFRSARSVAIAISDETRPVPNALILPILLERLHQIGIPRSSIDILIASGLHEPLPPSRFPHLLPQTILDQYRVQAHDAKAKDLVECGKTTRGTPVFVHPLFRRADLRLAVGLIDPHQFVGYTGGVKCAAVGLAGAQTIEANHSLLFHPQAVVGEIQNNPVRQDIEEIGKIMGVHFVINVVLDEGNRLLKAFAGDPQTVESLGSQFCRTVYEIQASQEFDVVIASCGGYPKDINVYQAQKGLAHVTPLVKKGGIIVLLAQCPDGHGSETFYRTMKRYSSPSEVVEGFQKEKFRMGAHKAFLWARSLEKARVLLVSDLPVQVGRDLMVEPLKTLGEAVQWIQKHYPRPPQIVVFPKANSTYVRISGKAEGFHSPIP
jgi:nickel-dependent lactate racemase